MTKFTKDIKFILVTSDDHKYYRSDNPNWVSHRYTLTENECDSTLITELNDLYYLFEVLDQRDWEIQIIWKDYVMCIFSAELFFKELNEVK